MPDPVEPSGTPGDPNYDPHWDPNWHEPEVPVPGLGVWPDDYVPANPGNADGHIDYPDLDAPVSPDQQRRNATLAMYAVTIYVAGEPRYGFQGNDLGQLRETLKAFLLSPPWGRDAAPFVQVQVLDVINQTHVDVSGGTPPAGWDGYATAEVRVMCGWGDKL